MGSSYAERLNLVKDFIGEEPYSFALKHYSKEYADILNHDLSIGIKNILESCKHNRDRRTIIEYAQDLLLGWIIEDYVLGLIKDSEEVRVTKNGADAKREFLINMQVKTDSDYLIEKKDKKFFVELISDYTGFWYKNERCHLRDNKLSKLIRHSKEFPTLLLAIDVRNRRFIIKRVYEGMEYKRIESHFQYGGKPACEIKLLREEFLDLNMLTIEMLEA